MDANSKYFHLTDSDDAFVLDDRLEINWTEIALYPIPLILYFFFLPNIFIGLPIILFATLGYLSFRYFAWAYYTEFSISKQDGVVTRKKKLFSDIKETDTLGVFNRQKLSFEPAVRSGTTKFICTYHKSKPYALLVVKSEVQKQQIEHWFDQVASYQP